MKTRHPSSEQAGHFGQCVAGYRADLVRTASSHSSTAGIPRNGSQQVNLLCQCQNGVQLLLHCLGTLRSYKRASQHTGGKSEL